jgi:hypothetical protein
MFSEAARQISSTAARGELAPLHLWGAVRKATATIWPAQSSAERNRCNRCFNLQYFNAKLIFGHASEE